ncbi:MAG TPA: hypothetical protein VL371_26000, partial [Gemmataceae bacterium]|nr:hypothetical protein [Gemmataceae bacterium]
MGSLNGVDGPYSNKQCEQSGPICSAKQWNANAMTKPADELVDVVDESGRIVARVTRGEMRSKRLPHRCVYVLVFDSA